MYITYYQTLFTSYLLLGYWIFKYMAQTERLRTREAEGWTRKPLQRFQNQNLPCWRFWNFNFFDSCKCGHLKLFPIITISAGRKTHFSARSPARRAEKRVFLPAETVFMGKPPKTPIFLPAGEKNGLFSPVRRGEKTTFLDTRCEKQTTHLQQQKPFVNSTAAFIDR